jgi:hypothetical protein
VFSDTYIYKIKNLPPSPILNDTFDFDKTYKVLKELKKQ